MSSTLCLAEAPRIKNLTPKDQKVLADYIKQCEKCTVDNEFIDASYMECLNRKQCEESQEKWPAYVLMVLMFAGGYALGRSK